MKKGQEIKRRENKRYFVQVNCIGRFSRITFCNGTGIDIVLAYTTDVTEQKNIVVTSDL